MTVALVESPEMSVNHAATRVSIAAPRTLLPELLQSVCVSVPEAECFEVSPNDQTPAFIDVAIVRLSFGDMSPLAAILSSYERMNRPELVVVVDHLLDPAAHAMARLGVKRIVECCELQEWLSQNAALLRAIARGRWAERRIRLSSHSWIDRPWASAPKLPPLYEAEQRFRESYVRALLAISSSRREAAERAGVPYRTFCHVMNSLGIHTPERPQSAACASSTT